MNNATRTMQHAQTMMKNSTERKQIKMEKFKMNNAKSNMNFDTDSAPYIS